MFYPQLGTSVPVVPDRTLSRPRLQEQNGLTVTVVRIWGARSCSRAIAHLNAAQEELFLARLGPHTNKRRSLVVKIPTIQAWYTLTAIIQEVLPWVKYAPATHVFVIHLVGLFAVRWHYHHILFVTLIVIGRALSLLPQVNQWKEFS